MTYTRYATLFFALALIATGVVNLTIQPGHFNEWPRWFRAALTTSLFFNGLSYLYKSLKASTIRKVSASRGDK